MEYTSVHTWPSRPTSLRNYNPTLTSGTWNTLLSTHGPSSPGHSVLLDPLPYNTTWSSWPILRTDLDESLTVYLERWKITNDLLYCHLNQCIESDLTFFFFFFKVFVGPRSILCGHWYPVSDFGWLCPWVLKPGWIHRCLHFFCRLLTTIPGVILDLICKTIARFLMFRFRATRLWPPIMKCLK